MFLTSKSLGALGAGQVVVLPTLAPGTIVRQVIQTPATSVRTTQNVNIEDSQKAVLDRVPWPHQFFRSFMLAPKVPAMPFYQGYVFTDPVLVSMGYFKNPGPDTDRDVAQYLYDNQDTVNNHFQMSVQESIDTEKRDEAEQKKRNKLKNLEITVLGAVAGLVTAGIATAALAVAQAAYSVYNAKTLSAQALNDVKSILAYLNVSPIDMDNFRVWITKLVSSPPESPPTPASVAVTSHYTIFNNGNYLLQNDSAEAGLSQTMSLSLVGDRITVKDEQAKSVYRVYLRVRNGLIGIPPEDAHLVQTLPQAQAISMANGQSVDQAADSVGRGLSPALLLAIPAIAGMIWMKHR